MEFNVVAQSLMRCSGFITYWRKVAEHWDIISPVIGLVTEDGCNVCILFEF